MTKDESIRLYLEGYHKLKGCLDELPSEMWDFKPSPDKWSVREIVIHIMDSEINAYVRCRKIIAETGSTITTYDQDKWAQALNYKDHNIDIAVEVFKFLRMITHDLLMILPDSTWENFIIHPERGKIKLTDWLKEYIVHINKHCGQMQRNLDEWQKQNKS
ncbi:MAG: DinB family protein [Ignavibacteriales bacterium]|nr:MAG: DinB family protein [Ignavibacteriales bacterium]